MAIELSTITFTDQGDVIPAFGVEEILFNTGIANTLAGNDIITGTTTEDNGIGFSNIGTLNTNNGNDIITGTGAGSNGNGIINTGYIETGDGNDEITGTNSIMGVGFFNYGGGIDTGNGDDIITGISEYMGILADGTINTGKGNDSISSQGTYQNFGRVFLGDGNDSIIVYIANTGGLQNASGVVEDGGIIDTGGGNDIIISDEILNAGVINTGKGDDSIISNRGVIYNFGNYGSSINTGDGNDSIIADYGFESGDKNGSVFLENGNDYLKGSGNGDFYGGNGNDTLELTPGSYTVGIWDTSVTFAKNNAGLMITSEFEKLIAGSTIYDFTSLTAGQIIVVA
jgi:hypothetical protein